jgi:crotonobetainyl-CoA:carnitine CoA-transferase CaiB-like acyl-CoA transferase
MTGGVQPATVPPEGGALAGVRVLEFGNLVAAPYCGMLLADLGADVVKIEPPGGDLARQIGPFINGESAFFMSVNRGKRSLAIDARRTEGAAALRRLCLEADVVVHNLRRGAMDRMGLGYPQLMAGNPRLVFAAITAFGSSGPYANRAGIDLIFQGESGMMSITGDEGEGPHKTATTIGDFVAGTNAALAICAALVARETTGGGRLIEVSLRDGLIAVQAGWNAQFFATGVQPRRTATASPVTGPNQTLRTGDGHLNLAVVSDRHFVEVCRVLGRAGLASDPRFASNELRVANRDELAGLLQEVLGTDTTDHWLALFDRAGVPAGRVLDLAEVFSDPQVIHNEMVVDFDHPRAGHIRTQGSPIRLDGSPARSHLRPPLLGEHTDAVLGEVGLASHAIATTAGEAVIPGAGQ